MPYFKETNSQLVLQVFKLAISILTEFNRLFGKVKETLILS